MIRVLLLVAAVCGVASVAQADGCDFVRSYRAEILGMSAESRSQWIARLGLTPSDVSAARKCLFPARNRWRRR